MVPTSIDLPASYFWRYHQHSTNIFYIGRRKLGIKITYFGADLARKGLACSLLNPLPRRRRLLFRFRHFRDFHSPQPRLRHGYLYLKQGKE
jgi:hypothetical protein